MPSRAAESGTRPQTTDHKAVRGSSKAATAHGPTPHPTTTAGNRRTATCASTCLPARPPARSPARPPVCQAAVPTHLHRKRDLVRAQSVALR